jgi:hypothetical protein
MGFSGSKKIKKAEICLFCFLTLEFLFFDPIYSLSNYSQFDEITRNLIFWSHYGKDYRN